MANAMVALANLTLGSAQATVTFSSIPATYRDLRLVANIALSGDIGTSVQFNSDAGANYSSVRMFGNGSTATSQTSTAIGFGIQGATAQTTLTTNIIFEVLDYSATDKHKSVLNRVNDAASESLAAAGRWASTSAITSLQCIASGGTFSIGSTFALYGIVS